MKQPPQASTDGAMPGIPPDFTPTAECWAVLAGDATHFVEISSTGLLTVSPAIGRIAAPNAMNDDVMSCSTIPGQDPR
jgi:hypothetical protein